MQKRFCECGYLFWVQYLFQNNLFIPLFWPSIGDIKTISTCPHCGRRLDINQLR
ncbi:hypothetical protein [Desulfoplanes formicivorans]|uniref:hypothetical protein n=1 Tax=Desulfoplanes formicivorans TaxID=1592317 RepID=UPI00159F09AE|nr:hypothetical protein [Desulfoplanes formicivorans]